MIHKVFVEKQILSDLKLKRRKSFKTKLSIKLFYFNRFNGLFEFNK